MGFKYYTPKPRTIKQIVSEKIRVLEDFYIIVNDDQRDEIRNMLLEAVKARPESDPDYVVDQVAKGIIADALS